MAFSNLFRRYSTSNEFQSASYAYIDGNSIAEALLEELESQCRNALATSSIQNKRESDTLASSIDGSIIPTSHTSINSMQAKRHSSVDYSWLSPNNTFLQSTNESYHLSEIIKLELSELILNVLPEDCTLIINQFRRHIRGQTKSSTPESVIALFRKTISDYIDQKPKNRASTGNINDTVTCNLKSNNKSSSKISSYVRNNRINPKHEFDDEQHCIAELTEISITSSSNDGTENNNPNAKKLK